METRPLADGPCLCGCLQPPWPDDRLSGRSASASGRHQSNQWTVPFHLFGTNPIKVCSVRAEHKRNQDMTSLQASGIGCPSRNFEFVLSKIRWSRQPLAERQQSGRGWRASCSPEAHWPPSAALAREAAGLSQASALPSRDGWRVVTLERGSTAVSLSLRGPAPCIPTEID